MESIYVIQRRAWSLLSGRGEGDQERFKGRNGHGVELTLRCSTLYESKNGRV